MPMIQVFVLLAVAAVLLPAIGYPVAVASFRASSARRILWSYPLATALLLAATRTCASIGPMNAAMLPVWAAVAIWLVLHWRQPALRKAFAEDIVGVPAWAVVSLAGLILVCAWGSVFPLGHHGTILFEGSPNHDSIYYIANTHWLLTHAVGEQLAYTPGSPVMAVSYLSLGPDAKLGRLGSESLLAFVSATFGKDPVHLYNAMQALGVSVGGITALCVLPDRVLQSAARFTPAGVLATVATVLAPQLLQMAVNSNYASLFGTLCLTTIVAAWFQSRDRWLNPAVLVASIGLVATYTEQVPIALGIVGAICLMAWLMRTRTLKEAFLDGCRCGANVAVAAILVPWITLPGLKVLKTAYFEVSANAAAWDDPYRWFSGARYAYAYLTTSGPTASLAPSALLVAGALALCAGAIAARRQRDDTTLAVGILLGFGALTLLMFVTHYNYGKLKIVEYFSLLLTPAALALVFHDDGSFRLDWRYACSRVAIAVIAGFNVAGFAGLCLNSSHFGQHKRITADFIDLAHETSRIAGDRAVAVRFTESPYFFSMWYPYFSSSPVVFSPEFGSGGYIQTYSNAHPYAPFESAPIAVGEARSLHSGDGAFHPLVQRGAYAAANTRDVADISISGGYGMEGSWFWMGPELRITVRAKGPHQLNVVLGDRFAPEPGSDEMVVSLGDKACTAKIPGKMAELVFDLQDAPTQTLVIRPGGLVRSPAEMGLNGDVRKLTYRVYRVSLGNPSSKADPTCELR